MAVRIIGTNDYTFQGQRRSYSRTAGWQTIKKYKGPADKIQDFSETLVDNEEIDSFAESTEGGVGTVDVTVVDDNGSGAEQVTTEINSEWELVGQDIYRDIRSHKTFNLDADQADLEDVRQSIERAQPITVPAADPEKSYYKLMLRGTVEYVRSTVVLRQTIQVGPRSLVTASWTGVDRAWRLDSESGSPNLTTAGEATIIGAISQMPDADSAKKQWLKRAPTLRKNGRKTDIAQDWWFARLWSHILYEGDDENGNP